MNRSSLTNRDQLNKLMDEYGLDKWALQEFVQTLPGYKTVSIRTIEGWVSGDRLPDSTLELIKLKLNEVKP